MNVEFEFYIVKHTVGEGWSIMRSQGGFIHMAHLHEAMTAWRGRGSWEEEPEGEREREE